MGQRKLRVNELILREINSLLRTYYQGEAVAITVFEVDVAPDLRQGRVYYSVLGGAVEEEAARRFFQRRGAQIRQQVGKQITLKYLPHLSYIHDTSMERGARTIALLEEIEETDHETDGQH